VVQPVQEREEAVDLMRPVQNEGVEAEGSCAITNGMRYTGECTSGRAVVHACGYNNVLENLPWQCLHVEGALGLGCSQPSMESFVFNEHSEAVHRRMTSKVVKTADT
jgi:hypothetical protein